MVVVDILCSLLKAGSVRWVYWSCILWKTYDRSNAAQQNRTSSWSIVLAADAWKRSAKVPKELQLFGRQLTEGSWKKRLLSIESVTHAGSFTYCGINIPEREKNNLCCNTRCPARCPTRCHFYVMIKMMQLNSCYTNMAHTGATTQAQALLSLLIIEANPVGCVCPYDMHSISTCLKRTEQHKIDYYVETGVHYWKDEGSSIQINQD